MSSPEITITAADYIEVAEQAIEALTSHFGERENTTIHDDHRSFGLRSLMGQDVVKEFGGTSGTLVTATIPHPAYHRQGYREYFHTKFGITTYEPGLDIPGQQQYSFTKSKFDLELAEISPGVYESIRKTTALRSIIATKDLFTGAVAENGINNRYPVPIYDAKEMKIFIAMSLNTLLRY